MPESNSNIYNRRASLSLVVQIEKSDYIFAVKGDYTIPASCFLEENQSE